MTTEMNKKIEIVKGNFTTLLESISSVNGEILKLSAQKLSEENLEDAQKYSDDSNKILIITRDLLELKDKWNNQLSQDVKEIKSKDKTNDLSNFYDTANTNSTKKQGYYCNGDQITMEFESFGGKTYSLKIPKAVLIKITTYVVEYLKVNEYIQSKDVVAQLGDYLSENTNYKDIKPIASKTLRFLTDRELLKFRNGTTGYYILAKTEKDVFDFLRTFDKR